MTEDILRVCAIDIGVITFTVYVEDCNLSDLAELRSKFIKLPKWMQRRTKGDVSSQLQTILDEMYVCGQRRFLEVTDVRSDAMKYEGKNGNGPLDIETRLNLHAYLEAIRGVFEDVDVIRIEQQFINMFSRGKKKASANMNAIKLAEDVFWWLITNFPEKDIDYFGANFKTQVLGAAPKLTKPQRKKWSVSQATRIFEMRGDTEALDGYKRKKGIKTKNDDKSDTVIMCQAFKYRTYVAMF